MSVRETSQPKPKRSVRVAFVAYTEYLSDPRVRREAEMLADEGYAVEAITLRPTTGPTPVELHGVRLWGVPLARQRGGRTRYVYQYSMFLVLSAVLLLRLHLRHPFRFVHVHSLPDFQVFCALPLRVVGVPVLLDLHEAMPEILEARLHVPPTAAVARLAVVLEALSCRFANHVVAANDGIRDALVARGLPSRKITTLYNAAELPRVEEVPETLRGDLGIPQGRLLVHAGGINPERDLPTLLVALSRLHDNDDIQIVLAGEGDHAYVEELQTLAARLGIQERVHFVGQLSRSRALALMSLSELGVVTLEANPLTDLAWPTRLAEFAAMGKPLVVPRLRFIESQLHDSARYYVPGDPESLQRVLEESLDSAPGADATADKARGIAQRFNAGAIRAGLTALYQTMEGLRAG